MAGTQQQTVATAVEQQRLGYNGITLTNFTDATSVPAIAAGSKVEIAGSLFLFASEESITGWTGITTATTAYVKLTVAGTAVAAAYTASTPVWSESKQGYYASAASNARMVAGVYKAGTSTYQDKWLFMSRWRFGEESTGEMVVEGPGFVIKQGATDGNTLQVCSTDISHGLTSLAATDCFLTTLKHEAAGGGALLRGFSDGNATLAVAAKYEGFLQISADTVTTSAARAILELNSSLHDGAGSVSSVGATGNIFSARNNNTTQMLLKGNGDIWLAGSSVSIDGGTDSDARIEFASDAALLWDESDGQFEFNQQLYATAAVLGVPSTHYIFSAAITGGSVFSQISTFISATGETILMSGGFGSHGGVSLFPALAERFDATTIRLHSMQGTEVASNFGNITQGASALYTCALAW